jgi:tRNA threonylcarbamoyladenosine biosynthesis protein TsaB
MKILAFDTCFDACSVAARIGPDAPVVTERQLMRRGHAEVLMPMIARVMEAAGLAFADLDRIAVTHGPGTFTGTRIGIAAAIGFTVRHATPVATASSLAVVARTAAVALAGRLSDLDGIAVVRDARRDSVYLEITDAAGNFRGGPRLAALGEAVDSLAGRRLFAFGSGLPVLEAHAGRPLAGVTTVWPVSPPDGIEQPDARFLLDLAPELPATTSDPAPLFLRPPDATPAPPLPGTAGLGRAARRHA